MNKLPVFVSIPIGSFDTSVLPEGCRSPGTEAFQNAVLMHFIEEYAFKGYSAAVAVDSEEINIAAVHPEGPTPFEYCLQLLNSGKLAEAIPMLEICHKCDLKDAEVAYNLGVAYSELGRYGEAVDALENAVSSDPNHVNAHVALGVAFSRLREPEQSIEALRKAISLDPANGWANRNLGAQLMAGGNALDALPHMREALHQLPDDPQSMFGLAECLVMTGDSNHLEEADGLYNAIIRRFPDHPVAELCREGRTKIAHRNLKENVAGGIRMDVVMYIADALKLFKGMDRMKVGELTMEIAMLGRSGLDINNPDRKYQLKQLPGDFTGLHLLAIMHAGIRQFDKSVDTGADFDKELEIAKSMMSGDTK